MKKAGEEPQFKYHPHCKALRLTHLIFAADLLLFCKADPLTLQSIMKVLESFHQCAGLKANIHESQMVFGGVSHDL